jgi:hypothetical protein
MVALGNIKRMPLAVVAEDSVETEYAAGEGDWRCGGLLRQDGDGNEQKQRRDSDCAHNGGP